MSDKSSLKASSPLRTILRVSRLHSKLLFCHPRALRPRFSLTCHLVSELHLTWVLQQSSPCPNHIIQLVQSTTSMPLMPTFERRESVLTSFFVLTLPIQRIIARPLRWKSLLHAASRFSRTLNISDLGVKSGRLRLVRWGSSWRNLPQAQVQRVIASSSQPPWSGRKGLLNIDH